VHLFVNGEEFEQTHIKIRVSGIVVTMHSNPGMIDVCFQQISGLSLRNDAFKAGSALIVA
jgi:hypothetical protein